MQASEKSMSPKRGTTSKKKQKDRLSVDLDTSELDCHKESTHEKPWKGTDLQEISDGEDDELINIMAKPKDEKQTVPYVLSTTPTIESKYRVFQTTGYDQQIASSLKRICTGSIQDSFISRFQERGIDTNASSMIAVGQ